MHLEFVARLLVLGAVHSTDLDPSLQLPGKVGPGGLELLAVAAPGREELRAGGGKGRRARGAADAASDCGHPAPASEQKRNATAYQSTGGVADQQGWGQGAWHRGRWWVRQQARWACRAHLDKPEVIRVNHLLVEVVVAQANHIAASVKVVAAGVAAAATAAARAAAAAAPAAAGVAAAALHSQAAQRDALCLLQAPLHDFLGGAAALVVGRGDLARGIGPHKLDGGEPAHAKLQAGLPDRGMPVCGLRLQ